MKNVNEARIIGNVGETPVLNRSSAGNPVCNLKVATTHEYFDTNDKKQQKTDWHRITIWGNQAILAVENLHKGSLVYISGRMETKTQERNGTRYCTTDVIANTVIWLDTKTNEEKSVEIEEFDFSSQGESNESIWNNT